MKKIKFEMPKVVYAGKIEKLTGEGGYNNDDGYKYTRLPKK